MSIMIKPVVQYKWLWFVLALAVYVIGNYDNVRKPMQYAQHREARTSLCSL